LLDVGDTFKLMFRIIKRSCVPALKRFMFIDDYAVMCEHRNLYLQI